ncbi:MAG: hypothetical protein MJZ24_11030, partial [Paludibacteraceae bacterium]|nr:hypothetical protein [Paludibacteraceae bacterium]
MNTKHFFRSLAMLFVTLMGWIMPQVVWAEYDGTPVRPTGEGTESDPYQIATAAHLYWFAALVNGDSKVCTGGIARNEEANAILTADIVVNDTTDWEKWGTDDFNDKDLIKWTPIGDGIDYKMYGGTFDGNGHTISGLYFNDGNADYVGLFGWNYRTIQNVGVEASYLKGGSSVGGVCGENGGTVSNCYNTGSVNGSEYVGGVCG